MDSDDKVNKKDLDKTVLFSDASRNTASHPDDLFFFLKNTQENEILIPEKTPVNIGRSRNQDFIITDQTVSREHLVLLRKKNDVHILVKGANGIVVDGYTYQSGDEVTIRPPKTFEVGGVTCAIRNDDTVIMHQDNLATVIENTDDNYPGRSHLHQPPLPADTFFEPFENKEKKQQDFALKHSSGKSLLDDEGPYSGYTVRPAHESFAPKIKSLDAQAEKDRYTRLMLFAGGAAVFLLIAMTSLIWKQYQPHGVADAYRNNDLAKTSLYQLEEVDSHFDGRRAETEQNRYDKSLIDRAEILMQRKEWETAKDYLLDIPKNSIYYDEARQMILNITRMTEG